MKRRVLLLLVLLSATTGLALGGVGFAVVRAPGATPAESAAKVRIAYIPVAVANAYQAAVIDAAKREAKRLNASVSLFDPNWNSGDQIAQLEQVTALGTNRFDAVGVAPLNAVAIMPAVREALKAGLKVGNTTLLGPKFNTPRPQVPGISVSVMAVDERMGQKQARMAILACKNVNPCSVAWVGSTSTASFEVARKNIFDRIMAQHPNIKVTTVGDTEWSREGGLKVIGTLIQSKPDIHVILAADQALLGAETALRDAGVLGKVKLIGVGGVQQAKARIKDGRWFGTVAMGPRTEGTMMVRGLVKAVRTGVKTGGIDSTANLPNNGMITRQFIARWKPQFVG